MRRPSGDATRFMTREWTGSLRSDRPLGPTVKRRHLNGVLGSSVRSRPTNVSGPLARGGGAATAGAAQADSTRRATPIAVLMTASDRHDVGRNIEVLL